MTTRFSEEPVLFASVVKWFVLATATSRSICVDLGKEIEEAEARPIHIARSGSPRGGQR
jgi:hypothetical protein